MDKRCIADDEQRMFKLWKRKTSGPHLALPHRIFLSDMRRRRGLGRIEELARGTVILTVMGTSATGHTSDHFGHNSYAYAREDAAAFVASEGAIYGVQLERAWRNIKPTLLNPGWN